MRYVDTKEITYIQESNKLAKAKQAYMYILDTLKLHVNEVIATKLVEYVTKYIEDNKLSETLTLAWLADLLDRSNLDSIKNLTSYVKKALVSESSLGTLNLEQEKELNEKPYFDPYDLNYQSIEKFKLVNEHGEEFDKSKGLSDDMQLPNEMLFECEAWLYSSTDVSLEELKNLHDQVGEYMAKKGEREFKKFVDYVLKSKLFKKFDIPFEELKETAIRGAESWIELNAI